MKISKYNIIKEYNDKILVYNSFSKASLILEKNSDISAFFDIEKYKKLDKNTKMILYSNGFVVDDERNEFEELKYLFQQKYFESNILNIILVPSLNCNFKCPYCFEKDLTCGKQDVKKYFDVLKKYAEKYFSNYKIIQISLFGGEPLLYINDCIDFLEFVANDSKNKKYEYVCNIVTNGSLLTEKTFDKLKKYNLRSLQITIDSEKKIHDKNRIFKNGKPSFDMLIDKINMITRKISEKESFKLIVRINLNNTTVEGVRNSIDKINNKEKVYLLIRAIYNTHAYDERNINSVDELKEYYDMSKELGFNILKERYFFQTCEACGDKKIFQLMPDLSMWKCINDLKYKKAKIGKLDDNGDPVLIPENIVNWYKNCTSGFFDKKCINCKMLPDCLGGCPLYKCKNKSKSCRTFDMFCLPVIY